MIIQIDTAQLPTLDQIRGELSRLNIKAGAIMDHLGISEMTAKRILEGKSKRLSFGYSMRLMELIFDQCDRFADGRYAADLPACALDDMSARNNSDRFMGDGAEPELEPDQPECTCDGSDECWRHCPVHSHETA